MAATCTILDEIKDLEFTMATYVRAERQSIGFAVSRLCDLPGAAGHLCKAITELEKVETLISRRVNALKAMLKRRGKGGK